MDNPTANSSQPAASQNTVAVSNVPPDQAPPLGSADAGQAIAAINAVAAVPLPSEAADTDNIEPEWVDKAKHIVAGSRDDPFRQVQELHQLRVDYMKKRYNKDLTQPASL